VGALIGILALGFIVWFLVATPEPVMPLGASPELKTTQLSEPIGDATRSVQSRPGRDAHHGGGPSGLGQLDRRHLGHRGQIDFNVSGVEKKTVTLGQSGSLGFPWIGSVRRTRQLGDRITPDLPLEMEILGGSGSAELNLAQLQISSLNLDVASGSVRASLPATKNGAASWLRGSGRLDLSLPERSQIDMT